MSNGLNKCFFIGNLTRDVEVRYAASGAAIANFSIACNESWKDKDGNKQEKVEFVRVVVFISKLAEICEKYLAKGKQVFVEGKMQTSSWEKDGEKRYSTEIVASNMQMLGGKGQETAEPSGDEDVPPF